MSKFDAVVVGSGAAGSAAAWSLCEQGFNVVCLEQGVWQDASKYPSTSPDWELQKRTRHNPVMAERQNQFDYPVDDSQSPIAMCNFNAVGGSTILYSGHFPRFRPRDFKIKAKDKIADDWPITYQDLRPFFDVNEHQMSMSGLVGDPCYPDIKNALPPVPLGLAGAKLAAAFNRKKWHWWPSYSAISTRPTRGRNSCINLGPCNTGCPQGAKSSTDVTYLPRAIQKGLTLITNASVFEVITERGHAIGVRFRDETRKIHEIYARVVILAASALGTPRILLNSKGENYPNGLANSSDAVGRNLMLHPLGYVEGVFDKNLDVDLGPQGCMLYSHEFYRSEEAEHKLGYTMHALRGTGPVEAATSALQRRRLKFGPGIFEDFLNFYKRQMVLSIICEDTPKATNRIELDEKKTDRHEMPGLKIAYSLDENTKKMMVHGMSRAKEVLIEAGAKKIFAHGPVRNTGWHIMGTARMGNDPKSSVVNKNGSAHDIDGLYIVDSSCFVTSSCVNPANTIQALALLISDKISCELKA
ncbi:GMC family oxidoreductase [Pseudopelagicola sp. nBUS_20]|uniref:GMC family oxidoreductase n=1 Tax=Pseudopelagicola sp. nBUS_20 TaxID=3395317 RepID=UPI003EBD1D07